MENRFKTLLRNYMDDVDGIIAVAICDRHGLIISSESKEESESNSIIGVISVVIDSYIDRIKAEFGTESNFFNITTTGDKKFAYCSQGPHSILTTIAKPSTSDIELKVYSEHIARKVEKLISGNEDVSLEIPKIIRILSKTRDGKLPEGEISTKLILIGDYMVGKTSLIKMFVENRFEENYMSTIGIEISKKTIDLGSNTRVHCHIWDIGGQRQEMSLYRKHFYTGAESVFIVVDRTRSEALKSVDFWYNEIKRFVPVSIHIVLVGNKSDLKDDLQISEQDIKEVADKYGFHHILTSAKTGENLKDSFLHMAYEIVSKI